MNCSPDIVSFKMRQLSIFLAHKYMLKIQVNRYTDNHSLVHTNKCNKLYRFKFVFTHQYVHNFLGISSMILRA